MHPRKELRFSSRRRGDYCIFEKINLKKGSNITAERLRFDFSHPEPMTSEQVSEVEEIVNQQISRDLPVHFETMTLEEAKRLGVQIRTGQRVLVREASLDPGRGVIIGLAERPSHAQGSDEGTS